VPPISKDDPLVVNPAEQLNSLGFNFPPGFDPNSFGLGFEVLGAPTLAAAQTHAAARAESLVAQEEYEADPVSHLPDMIPASEPLNWDELSELPRVAVTAAQITEWQNDPNPLVEGGDVFLNPDGFDGEPEAWRVLAIYTSKGKNKETKQYYVQTSGDDLAYAFSSRHFWEMLAESERMVRA